MTHLRLLQQSVLHTDKVFGNAHVMDFERCTELEAQFKDGRLTVRDFVKGLAKSSFYKKRFLKG